MAFIHYILPNYYLVLFYWVWNCIQNDITAQHLGLSWLMDRKNPTLYYSSFLFCFQEKETKINECTYLTLRIKNISKTLDCVKMPIKKRTKTKILNLVFQTMCEASFFDWINMTKKWLEFDRKKFTPTNVGTWPKIHTNKH